MKSKFLVHAFLGAIALALPLTAQADQPGQHPAYIHALADLRNDAAIAEIKRAAIDDGKNIDDHTQVDFSKDYWGRLREASRALHAAHSDAKQEEDNDRTRGLQERALRHIDGAQNFVDQGIANAR